MFTQKTKIPVKVAIKLALAITLVMPMLAVQIAPAQAGTNVGGPIISDTTWTLANSPYIVIANIDVQQNVTLTIEPGVIIKFNSGTKLQVNGELIARGAANSLIVFTSNQTSPAPGDWGGIEFTSTAIPVAMDANGNYVSGSIMQHCLVEYAGYGKSRAINARSQLITNCIVQNNTAGGIRIEGSITTPGYVISSTIKNNQGFRQGGGVLGINSIIRGNMITNNSNLTSYAEGGGIYSEYSQLFDNIVVENSVNGGGGGIFVRDSQLVGNTVRENLALYVSGASGGGIYSIGSTLISNIVSNNYTYLAGNTYLGSGGGIYVTGGIASKNIVNSNFSGVGGGIYALNAQEISENIVYNNFATNGGGVWATGTRILTNTVIFNEISGASGSGMFVGYGGTDDITHNTIINNRAPADSFAGGLELNDVRTGVHYNTLYWNTPYDVSLVKKSTSEINGTHNYWGTVANVDILTQIYDWYDDDSRGKFLYIPYLQEPSPDAPLPPPTGLSVNSKNDSVTLTWNALPSFTTGWGYKVYYDTDDSMPPFVGTGLNEGDSPIDIGANTSYTFTGLDPNTDYYFAVTAYDNLGREGWYSNIARKLGGYWVYLPLVIKK